MEHTGRKAERSPSLLSVKKWRDGPANLGLSVVPFYKPPEKSEWEASWGPLEEAVCWGKSGAAPSAWQPLSSSRGRACRMEFILPPSSQGSPLLTWGGRRVACIGLQAPGTASTPCNGVPPNQDFLVWEKADLWLPTFLALSSASCLCTRN